MPHPLSALRVQCLQLRLGCLETAGLDNRYRTITENCALFGLVNGEADREMGSTDQSCRSNDTFSIQQIQQSRPTTMILSQRRTTSSSAAPHHPAPQMTCLIPVGKSPAILNYRQ